MDDSATLSIAFAPGVTVTKWTKIWAERHPQIALEVLPTDQSEQVSVVHDGTALVSFVRLPIDPEGLHVIPLYRERAVAVAAKNHLIAAAEAVTLADLAGEKMQSASTQHADRGPFDLVAAGVGVLVVPQSIARIQSRKDVVVRPITDAPETQIALVWRAETAADSDSDSAAASDASADLGADTVSDVVPGRGVSPTARAELISEFIGIVRGRTAQSSRSRATNEGSAKKLPPAKGSAKGTAKNPVKNSVKNSAKSSGSKSGGGSQRSGAEHAVNRKREAARKKHRGR